MTERLRNGGDYYNPALEKRLDHCRGVMRQSHEAGVKSGYLDMATGMRKTSLAAEDIGRCLEDDPDMQVLWLCHRESILEQAAEDVARVLPGAQQGFVIGGQMDLDRQVTFATFAQMNRIIGEQPLYERWSSGHFGYVVDDEAHHGPARTYRQVIDYYQPAHRKLGLTATPDRGDNQDIEDIFGPPIYQFPLEHAIAEGCLARPDYRLLTDHVRRMDEIDDLESIPLSQLDEQLFVPRRDGEIADQVYQHISEVDNPRSIVFCNTTAYADRMVDFMPGNVAALHSKISKDEQKQRLAKFRTGELDMLITVDMLNEGIHVPEANVAIMLRNTESRTVLLQQIGRFLGGKSEALILDFVASWQRIKDVRALEGSVNKAYAASNPQATPEQTKSQFRFDFDTETLNAIEVIEYARNKAKLSKPIDPNKVSRLKKWEIEEAELKAMLGVKNLPKQEVNQYQWQRLAERIAAGDEQAKQQLIMRHLRTVYGTAKKFAQTLDSNELTVEDHFQHAFEGLLDGLAKFDPKKHQSLRMHIQINVFNTLNRRAYGRGLVRIPINIYGDLEKVNKARQKLERKMGGAAVSNLEVADEIGFDEDKIDKLERLPHYENTLAIEEAPEVIDTAASTFEQVATTLRNATLMDALENLSYRERRLLELRYGLSGEFPQTIEQVGRVFKVTHERTRQIENQSLKKLQSLAETQKLRLGVGESHQPILLLSDPHERAVARSFNYFAPDPPQWEQYAENPRVLTSLRAAQQKHII